MSTALPLSTAILWVIFWFVCMLLYTTLDLLAWRKLHSHGSALHVFTILLFTLVYLHFLHTPPPFRYASLKTSLFENSY